MRLFTGLLLVVFAASLLPAPALAKQGDDRRTRIIVFPKSPKQSSRYGFLPGYRQPAPLCEWRDRSPRHGGGDFSRDRLYISGYEWRYGWGYPQSIAAATTAAALARATHDPIGITTEQVRRRGSALSPGRAD